MAYLNRIVAVPISRDSIPESRFSTVQAATSSKYIQGNTTRFIERITAEPSIESALRSSVVNQLPVFETPEPNHARLQAHFISTLSYGNQLKEDELQILGLTETSPLRHIIDTASQKLREMEDAIKKYDVECLYRDSAVYERDHKRLATAQANLARLRRPNDDDVRVVRGIVNQAYRFVDRHIDKVQRQYSDEKNRFFQERKTIGLTAIDTLQKSLPDIVLKVGLALLSGTQNTDTSLPDEKHPHGPLIAKAEREFESLIKSRLTSVLNYVHAQIQKYQKGSLLDPGSTHFSRVVKHTVPGLMATGEVFGLLSNTPPTRPNDVTRQLRQEALAIIALLIDPESLNARDHQFLLDELPLQTASDAVRLILNRHDLEVVTAEKDVIDITPSASAPSKEELKDQSTYQGDAKLPSAEVDVRINPSVTPSAPSVDLVEASGSSRVIANPIGAIRLVYGDDTPLPVFPAVPTGAVTHRTVVANGEKVAELA